MHAYCAAPALHGSAQDDSATRAGTYQARSPSGVFSFFAQCTGGPTLLAARRGLHLLATVVPLRRDGPRSMAHRTAAWGHLQHFLQAIDVGLADFVDRSQALRREAARLRLPHLYVVDCPYVQDSAMGLVMQNNPRPSNQVRAHRPRAHLPAPSLDPRLASPRPSCVPTRC
jgi:hypothetical protein